MRRALAESAAAAGLWAELEPLSGARRFAAVAAEPRFATFGLIAYVLSKARHCGPGEAEHLARLALTAAAMLPEEPTTQALAWDFRGRAWAMVAVSRARRGELGAAEVALIRARAALAHGTGDPLEAAYLSESEAFLHRRRGWLPEAARSARRARRLLAVIGQSPPSFPPERSLGGRPPRRGWV